MPAANPESGTLIADQYRIEVQLGGVASSVFSATHLTTGRRVAIKWRSSADRTHPEGSLEHPHIVAVFDAGHHDGAPYLVMEYLEGESLADRLARGPLSLGECQPILLEAALAITAAHARGVVHGQLAPAHLFLNAEPPGVKLLGFGSAAAVDPRTDVRALAAVAYEALSGKPPDPAILTPLSQLVSDLPPPLETTVMRALSNEPVTLPELLDSLQPLRTSTAPAAPAPAPDPADLPAAPLSAAIWTEITEVDAVPPPPLPAAPRGPWFVVAGFLGLALATLVAGIAWAALQPETPPKVVASPPTSPAPAPEPTPEPTPEPVAAAPTPPPAEPPPARPKPEKRSKPRPVQHKTSGVSLADF